MGENIRAGTVLTFYSYKGGVGRSMALANVAVLLAEAGHRTLIVDWDLEAPGIERYFFQLAPYLQEARRKTYGVVDLIASIQQPQPIQWKDCLLRITIPKADHALSILTAGQTTPAYVSQLHELKWEHLFESHNLGLVLEKMRTEWTAEFDFILIDSRTGITDNGGICTIHLPDVLVLFCTTNEQSLEGIVEVMNRARSEQERLPFDRGRLLGVPVIARDESRMEYNLSQQWRKIFADRLSGFLMDWLPRNKSASDAFEILRLPNIPYWSFGERLPVIEEGISDPATLGFAYSSLAKIISAHLDWDKALEGIADRPTPALQEIAWEQPWIEKHRAKAFDGLKQAERNGFMEFRFRPSTNAKASQPSELLRAAKSAAIHTFGWPIGVVLSKPSKKPVPMSDGIVAEITSKEESYDYWALKFDGSFYLLRSLFEDERREKCLFVDTRIVQVTEAFLYCSKLLTALEVPQRSAVRIAIRHGGLQGRRLTVASQVRAWPTEEHSVENEIETELEEVLGQFDSNLVQLVKRVITPLLETFDFARIDDPVLEAMVTDFKAGKIR